jgi:hypothetical protein
MKYTEYTCILQNNDRMSPARGHNTQSPENLLAVCTVHTMKSNDVSQHFTSCVPPVTVKTLQYHRSQAVSFLRKFSYNCAHFCSKRPSHIQDQNSQQQVSTTKEFATQQNEILASRTPYTQAKNNP